MIKNGGRTAILPPLTHSDVALYPLTDREEPKLRTGNSGKPPANLLSPLNLQLTPNFTQPTSNLLLTVSCSCSWSVNITVWSSTHKHTHSPQGHIAYRLDTGGRGGAGDSSIIQSLERVWPDWPERPDRWSAELVSRLSHAISWLVAAVARVCQCQCLESDDLPLTPWIWCRMDGRCRWGREGCSAKLSRCYVTCVQLVTWQQDW